MRDAGTMPSMAGSDPGEPDPRGKRLTVAPSTRYADPARTNLEPGPSALPGPLLRALVAAAVGAALLILVGAVLASTFGLLFVAGGTGAAVGLALSRAAVPLDDAVPTTRRTLELLGVGIALAAVVVADVGTWLIALDEGGTLGLIDYLLTTFGPFVPGVALLAAIAAWWGASSGPVQS
jgi:hypothetical protein